MGVPQSLPLSTFPFVVTMAQGCDKNLRSLGKYFTLFITCNYLLFDG